VSPCGFGPKKAVFRVWILKKQQNGAPQHKTLAMGREYPILQPMLHCNIFSSEYDPSAVICSPLIFNLIGEITMMTVEQVLAAQKANVEILFGLTNKAFAGVEKLVELNIQASKAALSEASDNAKAVLSVKDAQELLAMQAGLFQPLAEKTASYSRHLYDIASSTGAEFTAAVEAQAADGQKKFMSLVDTASKNAPAGSESAVAMMKSAVAAAGNAIESVQKAVKQASEMAEQNFNNVAATAKTAAKKR
jgi:phasin family protein